MSTPLTLAMIDTTTDTQVATIPAPPLGTHRQERPPYSFMERAMNLSEAHIHFQVLGALASPTGLLNFRTKEHYHYGASN